MRSCREFFSHSFLRHCIPFRRGLYAILERRTTPGTIGAPVHLRFPGSKLEVDMMVGVEEEDQMNPYRDGEYEVLETLVLQKILKPGMKMIDVGANFGYFTLLGSRLVGDEGHVWAFEPQPRVFRLLGSSMDRNKIRNVTLIPEAVCDRNGELILYQKKRDAGRATLFSENLDKSDTQATVSTTSLDIYFDTQGEKPNIDMVKIDVEGAEISVWQGMSDLRRTNPKLMIFMEFWPYGMKNAGVQPETLWDEFRSEGYHVLLADRITKTVRVCPELSMLMKSINSMPDLRTPGSSRDMRLADLVLSRDKERLEALEGIKE